MRSEASSSSLVQHLGFFVGGEEYAVDLLRVKEIIQYAPVTRVPAMPPAVRGVINLRGRVVPVIDLALHFGGAETPITRWTCIVMLDLAVSDEQGVVGILVDSVTKVIELSAGDIEPPPAFGTRARIDFLRGMGKVDTRFILILDEDQLLAAFDAVPTAPAPTEGERSEEGEEGDPGPAADAQEPDPDPEPPSAPEADETT